MSAKEITIRENLFAVLPFLVALLIVPLGRFIKSGFSTNILMQVMILTALLIVFAFRAVRPILRYSEEGITLIRKSGLQDPDFIKYDDIAKIERNRFSQVLILKNGYRVDLFLPRRARKSFLPYVEARISPSE